MLTLVVSGPAHAREFTERCAGYGNRISTYLMDWEAGLGAWTASSNVANPATFDTPDWSVVGDLPDSRGGSAAFVPNLIAGDCAADDQTGLLRLESPSIVIPPGAEIPRVSIVHWFEMDTDILGQYWDGGQITVKVNGSPWKLLPASAFEQYPYNVMLEPATDDLGLELNTNPLAGMPVFGGTVDGQPTGQWVQSRINLLGIAQPGDTVWFRFDFGIDECTTNPANAVGWYVDDFEVYHCEAELLESNCGNGVINGAEECDDGNQMIGDGCSNVCTVESGWSCEPPTPSSPVGDYSFEAGTPNPVWAEFSTSSSGTPICSESTCNKGGGTGPADGDYWARFGNVVGAYEGSLSQSLTIPTAARTLTFQLEIPRCDTADDYLEFLIDGNPELVIYGNDAACEIPGYQKRSIDITPYADGGVHTIEFHAQTFFNGGELQSFFVDVVELPANPSYCRPIGTSLVLKKRVFNDNGGLSYPSEWTLEASGPSFVSGSGPVVVSGEGFLPGTYDLAEAGPAGYGSDGWICKGGNQVDSDTVSIATGEAVVCTLENEDIPPTVTVLKTVVNDNGGEVTDPDAFGLQLDYETVLHDDPAIVMAGDHLLAEDGLPGYRAGNWGGDCAPDGTVTVSLGQAATCTISNDDIPASLTVLKSIVNDDDGTINDPNAFGLQIDTVPVLDGIANSVDAGIHVVSEVGSPDYVPGPWGGDCAPDGSISLSLAQEATCTITNDDRDRTRLNLAVQVTNDDGGTEPATSWQLMASGPANFSGPGPSVSSGNGLPAGTYNLSIDGPIVYTAGDWSCVGGTQSGSRITLAIDEAATCTITVNDIAPTLKLIKNIVNDDGGTVTDPNAFGLRVDGISVAHNVPTPVDAGAHTVSEIGKTGYQASGWGGNCSPDGSITLELAQNATCIITNNDIAPTITVLKNIVNDDGGTVVNPSLFGLKVDGATVSHGVPKKVTVGTHTVSETGLPGYQPGAWGGACAADGTVTVDIGQNAVCAITNDDIAPTLTVLNTVIANDGGEVTDPNAFDLRIDGNPVLDGAANVLNAGSHVVSQSPVQGYEASSWGGDCDAFGNVDLEPGENATCTITNDDSGNTQLTLRKNVNNNSSGSATPSDFTLFATGPESFSGPGPAYSSGLGLTPGTYDLSESGPAGYEAAVVGVQGSLAPTFARCWKSHSFSCW
ncbi:MAG: myxococcus cysteine-rich repeat containing protein, partial [Planctomycetes bacterium]|nr:myxococcus cysteine-rich repeat containing protein [Planctomycetota bacterium]